MHVEALDEVPDALGMRTLSFSPPALPSGRHVLACHHRDEWTQPWLPVPAVQHVGASGRGVAACAALLGGAGPAVLRRRRHVVGHDLLRR